MVPSQANVTVPPPAIAARRSASVQLVTTPPAQPNDDKNRTRLPIAKNEYALRGSVEFRLRRLKKNFIGSFPLVWIREQLRDRNRWRTPGNTTRPILAWNNANQVFVGYCLSGEEGLGVQTVHAKEAEAGTACLYFRFLTPPRVGLSPYPPPKRSRAVRLVSDKAARSLLNNNHFE